MYAMQHLRNERVKRLLESLLREVEKGLNIMTSELHNKMKGTQVIALM
jgi:hypothetical protein